MRNIKFWCFMSVLLLAVFMLSGCGGGSLEEEGSNNSGSGSSNSRQVVYNASKVLPGTWRPYERVVTSINNRNVQLKDATLTIMNVNISNDNGTAAVTSTQRWHYVSEDLDITVKLEETNMNIVRTTGLNRWRGTSGTGKFGNVVLTISDDKIIKLNYEDRVSASYAPVFHKGIVSVEMNLRKTE